MTISLATLKTGLVFFWSLWLTVVFLTNLCEGLIHLGVLPAGWRFASQNYQLIQKTVSVYSPPAWLAGLLFLGVVLWQALALALMWAASFTGGLARIDTAFAVLLALWAAFMVADEIFRAYENQPTHLMVFTAQAVTLLMIHLL